MLANTDIRETAKEKGVRLWEIAEFLRISDPTMTRKLRRELSETEREKADVQNITQQNKSS